MRTPTARLSFSGWIVHFGRDAVLIRSFLGVSLSDIKTFPDHDGDCKGTKKKMKRRENDRPCDPAHPSSEEGTQHIVCHAIIN